ncbi:MAG: hypothetical protein IH782_11455 [candidate division NC10 bacterium]|nr:hypothetical protein [candidate division NC10 bacterium]
MRHPSFTNIAHRGASAYAPENTLAAFDKALALKPDFPEVLFNKANALNEQALLSDAVGCYRQALALEGFAAFFDLSEALADIGALARAGAVAFTDDGDCLADAGLMERALVAVRVTGRCFMQHCQEPSLTRGAVMNAGALADRLGVAGWPAEAEEIIIERDVRLNRPIGCRYHAQHLSSGGSVAIVRDARARGEPVSAEVSPHHLLLTEECVETFDTNYKMNPPLRTLTRTRSCPA